MFARPDAFCQLPGRIKREVEQKRINEGIAKGFGLMFRHLESTPTGRELLSYLRKQGFSRTLPKSRFD